MDQVPLHKKFIMGNSKNRTGLEWVEVGKYLRAIEKLIKKSSIVAFLDGSSTLSTGLAGSGVYILGPAAKNGLREAHEFSTPIEMGEGGLTMPRSCRL